MQDAINTKQVETIEVTGAGTINTSELEANEPAFEAFEFAFFIQIVFKMIF